MLFRILPSRSILAAAVLALPLTGGGCGRRACFTWSAREGACPAQSEALQFFSNPRCPGQITSVESPPTNELDGELCCYEVVADGQMNNEDDLGCQGFGGSNPATTGGGFGGSVGFVASTSVGQGGAGGTTTCARCAEVVDSLLTAQLCDDPTAFIVKTLIGCACNATCAPVCGATFCMGNPPTPECSDCLHDPLQGCGNEFTDCVNDL